MKKGRGERGKEKKQEGEKNEKQRMGDKGR